MHRPSAHTQHSFQNVITHDVTDVLGPVIARSVHLSQWLSIARDVTRRALRGVQWHSAMLKPLLVRVKVSLTTNLLSSSRRTSVASVVAAFISNVRICDLCFSGNLMRCTCTCRYVALNRSMLLISSQATVYGRVKMTSTSNDQISIDVMLTP